MTVQSGEAYDLVVSGGDWELRTRASIIATGSRVRPLPGVAIDGRYVPSAQDVWREATLPRSILIVGAGAIWVEFATVYRAYRCDVTLVEYLPHITSAGGAAARDARRGDRRGGLERRGTGNSRIRPRWGGVCR